MRARLEIKDWMEEGAKYWNVEQNTQTEGDLTRVHFRRSVNPVIAATMHAPVRTVINLDKVRALEWGEKSTSEAMNG